MRGARTHPILKREGMHTRPRQNWLWKGEDTVVSHSGENRRQDTQQTTGILNCEQTKRRWRPPVLTARTAHVYRAMWEVLQGDGNAIGKAARQQG